MLLSSNQEDGNTKVRYIGICDNMNEIYIKMVYVWDVQRRVGEWGVRKEYKILRDKGENKKQKNGDVLIKF